jgi:hypothetical protein
MSAISDCCRTGNSHSTLPLFGLTDARRLLGQPVKIAVQQPERPSDCCPPNANRYIVTNLAQLANAIHLAMSLTLADIWLNARLNAST